MSFDNRILTHPFPASGDLSGKKFYAVKINSDGEIVVATAITDIIFGILQNEPDAQGKEASVALEGISKIVLGATLAIGVQCGTSTAGKAIADASTNYTIGTIVQGGVSGDIGSVHLNHATIK